MDNTPRPKTHTRLSRDTSVIDCPGPRPSRVVLHWAGGVVRSWMTAADNPGGVNARAFVPGTREYDGR